MPFDIGPRELPESLLAMVNPEGMRKVLRGEKRKP